MERCIKKRYLIFTSALTDVRKQPTGPTLL